MEFLKIKDFNGLEHFINKRYIVGIMTIEDVGTQIILSEGSDIKTATPVKDFEKLLSK